MIELVALALGVAIIGPEQGSITSEPKADALRTALNATIPAPISSELEVHSAFGRLVSDLGDIDGDGTPDILIADTSERSGRVWLVSLGKQKTIYSVAIAMKDLSLTAQLCSVGDVDGDGHPDWMIGGDTSQYLRPKETEEQLKERRLSGSDPASVHSGLDGKLLFEFKNERPGQKLGCCVARFTDLDGDGRADVLVGARRIAEDKDGGVCYVRSGRDRKILLAVGKDLAAGERAYLVQNVGDVNADGMPDIGVVCTREYDAKPKLRIYSGKSGDVLRADVVESGEVLCLVGTGDLDHDGHADFMVGLRGVARVFAGGDFHQILELSSATLEKKPENQPRAASFGKAAAVLRARDRTVPATLVVSAIETDLWGGTVYFHASTDGRVSHHFSDSDLLRQLSIGGNEPDFDIHHLGNSLANLGDVDGDGFDDLACGVDDTFGAEDGRAFVFSGRHAELMYEFSRSGDELVVRDLREKR